jgi:2-methylcitrate dehydratase PrpD
MAKRVHAGRAAEGGLLAVLLAQDGVTGPAHAFEDVWGSFLKTYGHGPVQPEALTCDLGRDWLMRHAAIKPYASCRDTHAAVDALERVVTRHNLQAHAVASIRVRLNAFLDGMVGGRDVFNLPAAQMSLPYAAAARLLFGTAGLGAYSAERRSSPAVAELLPRIIVDIDETVSASWRSSIIVETRDGQRIEEPTTAPLGSPENPLPPDRLRTKFHELACMSLTADQADRLAEFALNLDDERDARALPALLRTPET